MRFFFSFFIFLSLIKLFFPLQNEYISYFNYESKNIKKDNTDYDPTMLLECKNKYLNSSDYEKSDFLQLSKCIINCSIYDIQNLQLVFALIKGKITPEFIDNNLKDNKTKIIANILYNNLYIIDDIYELIEKNPSILNYTLEFLIESEKVEHNTYENIYRILYKIFNIDGVYELAQKFYNKDRDGFMSLLTIILTKYEKLEEVFNVVNEYLKDYEKDVLDLAFNIIKNVNSNKNLTIIFADFFKSHKDIHDKLKIVLGKQEMGFVFDNLLVIQNDFIIALKNLTFSRNDLGTMDIFFEILKNDTLVDQAVDILININDIEYVGDNIGKFLSGLIAINYSYVDYVSNLLLELAFKINKNKELTSTAETMLQRYISQMFINENYSSFNINSNCLDLINYTYFNYEQMDKKLFDFYFVKYLSDSSRSKGNFLSFDNCLSEPETSQDINTGSYNIYPTFIIGIIYKYDLLEESKNSSFYSKYYYIESYCLPNGYRKEDNNKTELCTDLDYMKIFNFLINILNNKDKRIIEVFNINKNNKEINTEGYIYGFIALIILLLPIIINIALFISKKIIIKRQKTNINEIIGDDILNKKINKSRNTASKIDKKESKKVIFPNWYLYLNGCFNIVNNMKELFNFSLNNTNYYNINGMTYIKGLIGISLILTIFGQTFVSIANFPPKLYGLFDFNEIMSHYILYPFLFFGYRYGPRILFSCSGYSFIYKYLCYIEQEENFYFLKFIFLQSYKYILLFLVLFYFRYLLYYLIILFNQEKKPVWEIFGHYMEKENNFFTEFLSFLFHFNDEEDKNVIPKQHLIRHFYIPINEVFFFIFGMLLISFGYKYKLRIDLIIIALILIVYFLKIFAYYLYLFPQNQILTTIDYLFIDFGLISLMPLFNISSFLIGIYFGLINYSIQKGITELEKKSNYNNIIIQMSETENSKDTDEEVSKINKSNFKNQLALKLSHLNINDYDSNEEDTRKKSNTVYSTKKRYNLKNIREDDVNDINEKNNEKLENFIGEKDTLKKSTKFEYSEKIKQMPFLITPIKFYNLHRKNKTKCYLNIIIIITFLIILFFTFYEIFFASIDIKFDVISKGSKLVKELSYEKIIPDWFLNFIYLIDIEIVIFIVQWITFILYFKEFEIIRSFINHIYWSFFVKSYFSFTLVSIPIILFVLYDDESMIKLYIYNILLYTLINIFLIIISMIIFYSFFELPLKKAVKCILKGKEALNIEEDENDDEEEEEEKRAEEEEEDEECPKDEDEDS